ncbi:sigma 54-interacting transcriptional regulator [Bacillus sp. FJAT-47783]|uniref:sigma-54 interaction domain-containing protein n=1 Tax=Bacillus sp. FJAT-47783 TaxID=2922712 RepID=UPI001FAC5B95|nr:sigma 54-interacting transcriptional regulator [Bacillus sp. FJAT-47783]
MKTDENLHAKIKDLEQRNHELELIFESSYDEIFVTDGNGVTIRVNSACERNYGIKAEELIGKSAKQLEEMGIFNQSVTSEVIKSQKRVSMFQKTRNGRNLLVTANPVMNENGEIVRIVCNSKDLTEISQLKKQLSEMENLVEYYNNELKKVSSFHRENFVFESKQMQKVMELALKVAESDVTTLILGESGIGKTALAKIIHDESSRKGKVFKKINCGAIPESLIEAELFGYVDGAFTGAKKGGSKGLIESADDGTVFLDEIGELPYHLQAKLLHVLQEKTIQRIGDTKDIPVNVRFIAATNKNLEKMVEEKTFREDLYYRLHVVPIEIPPLRERKEDIIPLIQRTVEKMNEKHQKNTSISPEVTRILLEYNWPGNIRELENIIERLIVTTDQSVITSSHLPEKFQNLVKGKQLDESSLSLKDWLEAKEKELFCSLYEKYPSSYKIAKLLKISQSTANRKIQKYISQY